MDQKRFFQWVKGVLTTEEQEISCSECFDLVSEFVDLELAGSGAQERMASISQHLIHCRACQEEYEVLRELARLEGEGRLPALDELIGPAR